MLFTDKLKKVEIVEIKKSELKEITLFLIDQKVIFHPIISPKGVPDFTGYRNKRFAVFLDRNILVRIKRLLVNGKLKDAHSLKLISCLLLWSEFNNISLNSVLALMEYSYHHGGNEESSEENNIFLQMYKQYSPKQWLELALGKVESIPKIKVNEFNDYNFNIDSDHFKMHYLEMLIITQLYFIDIPNIEKFKKFLEWVYKNILICKYTTYYAAMVLGNMSKMLKGDIFDFDVVVNRCVNQAWDLSHLSYWSTYYYYENNSDEVYLFATMDKELKELCILTHSESNQLFFDVFGEEGVECISETYKPRKNKKDSLPDLDKLIIHEEKKLKLLIDGMKKME